MAIATLPIVLSVVLAELAVGGSFLMWWVDRGGRAPAGFLKLVALDTTNFPLGVRAHLADAERGLELPTLEALGLKHHQDAVVKKDHPSLRGMLYQVRHLVEVSPAGEK